MYNPCIRGWIGYYGQFYKTQLRPTLIRINAAPDGSVTSRGNQC